MTDEKIYSAKQVATRIGTDAKTLRKFFRSSASPYDAVGQGGRYEFPESMLPEIKKTFDKWNSGKTPSTPSPKVNGKTAPKARGNRRQPSPKVDREPRDHRGLPYVPVKETRLNKLEFKGLRDQHGKARDKEYGTIDGEEPTLEQIEALQLTAEEIELHKDAMNEAVYEELEDDDEVEELD